MGDFTKIASKAPTSKDIEDRRTKTPAKKGTSLQEGYRNLIQQPIANFKATVSDIRESISPSGSMKGFERASRDLGGPRTPPYKGK